MRDKSDCSIFYYCAGYIRYVQLRGGYIRYIQLRGGMYS